ncbi:MAG: hypothetical protein IJT44_05015 [Clostridia bacterium]|nr:hypothetical protein [Clostridia bacterium]
MRKAAVLFLCLLLPALAACGAAEEEEPFSAAFTIRPEPTLTAVYYDTSYVGETRVLPGDTLDAGVLRALFLEALFGEEAQYAVRWTSDVQYALSGSFADHDAQTVSDIADALDRVDGFPGIRETTADRANVRIVFTDAAQVQFLPETDAAGRILSVQITVPSSWDGARRAAALHQTMMRACGFFYTVQTPLESVLRQDSPADALTEADRILLDALYGGVEAGDGEDVCMEKFDQALAAE